MHKTTIIKSYIVVGVLLLICSCRLSGSLSNRSAGPYLYETYAPVKESLSFINNSVCVYTRYDIYNRDSIVVIDTCYWKQEEGNMISIRCRTKNIVTSSYAINDSIKKNELHFIYDICPKWYNISTDEFEENSSIRYPLYQDPIMANPHNPAFFNQKYDVDYMMSLDTLMFMDICLVFPKLKKDKTVSPAYFFPTKNNKLKKSKAPALLSKEVQKRIYQWITNSYEYINYKVNYEKKFAFELDSIVGKQFSFIGESCKKESLRFVNDSVCAHYLSTRESVSSPYVPQGVDTCRYSVKNNLIAIDFEKDKSCDTLTYSNGIIFYSKVYKEGDKYTHIVKPFIDETRSCANKADSINMIMSTYFNVYVPLNLYK